MEKILKTGDVASAIGVTPGRVFQILREQPELDVPDSQRVGRVRVWSQADLERLQAALAANLEKRLKDMAPSRVLQSGGKPLLERLTNAATLMSGTAPDVILSSEQVCEILHISREQLWRFTESYASKRYGCRLLPRKARGRSRSLQFSARTVLNWLTRLEQLREKRH